VGDARKKYLTMSRNTGIILNCRILQYSVATLAPQNTAGPKSIRRCKIMANYEAMLVFSVANGEENVTALVEKFKSLIEAHGTVESVDEWGKRRLAYPINYENEGYYILINFSCEPEFPAELDRVVNITDGVLRSLIVAK